MAPCGRVPRTGEGDAKTLHINTITSSLIVQAPAGRTRGASGGRGNSLAAIKGAAPFKSQHKSLESPACAYMPVQLRWIPIGQLVAKTTFRLAIWHSPKHRTSHWRGCCDTAPPPSGRGPGAEFAA